MPNAVTHCSNCDTRWNIIILGNSITYTASIGKHETATYRGKMYNVEDQLKMFGWEFGQTIYTILHCPECKDTGIVKDPLKRFVEDIFEDTPDNVGKLYSEYDI